MEPTYSVPTLFMALRIFAVTCTITGVILVFQWWRLRGVKRQYLLEKRRGRGIAALVLLALGVPVLLFAPYEVKNDRLEYNAPTSP